MTALQAAGVIIIRFWAAHLAVRDLSRAESTIAELAQHFSDDAGEAAVPLAYPLMSAAGFVMGVGFFLLAKPAARILMPRGDLPPLSAEAERRWLYSGTALIGVCLLVLYLPFLLGAAAVQARMTHKFVTEYYPAEIIIAALVVIAALAMVFRIRNFMAWRAQVNDAILRTFTPNARKEGPPAGKEPPASS